MGDFWQSVQKLAEDAPEAGYTNINFGKLTVVPVVVRWTTTKNDEGQEIRAPERTALKDGQALKEGETLELQIKVEISELNPQLQFDYERSIAVRKSGPRARTDWSEIVLPSLEATFGKNWSQAIIGKTPYVAVEDVSNVAGKTSKSGKVLTVPKFVQVFKNKAECQAARDKRFTKREDSAVAVPDDDDTSGTMSLVPDEVVAQTVSLIKSVQEKKARKMLEGHPFGDYDADELIRLANEVIAAE